MVRYVTLQYDDLKHVCIVKGFLRSTLSSYHTFYLTHLPLYVHLRPFKFYTVLANFSYTNSVINYHHHVLYSRASDCIPLVTKTLYDFTNFSLFLPPQP